jgi:hypothetical protein
MYDFLGDVFWPVNMKTSFLSSGFSSSMWSVWVLEDVEAEGERRRVVREEVDWTGL